MGRVENSGAAKRRYHLKSRYGISQEQYDEMLARQGGGCAICGRPPKSKSLAVDHDHKTGRVRGLLCHPCNRALGSLGDSVEGLQRAIDYLET